MNLRTGVPRSGKVKRGDTFIWPAGWTSAEPSWPIHKAAPSTLARQMSNCLSMPASPVSKSQPLCRPTSPTKKSSPGLSGRPGLTPLPKGRMEPQLFDEGPQLSNKRGSVQESP